MRLRTNSESQELRFCMDFLKFLTGLKDNLVENRTLVLLLLCSFSTEQDIQYTRQVLFWESKSHSYSPKFPFIYVKLWFIAEITTAFHWILPLAIESRLYLRT